MCFLIIRLGLCFEIDVHEKGISGKMWMGMVIIKVFEAPSRRIYNLIIFYWKGYWIMILLLALEIFCELQSLHGQKYIIFPNEQIFLVLMVIMIHIPKSKMILQLEAMLQTRSDLDHAEINRTQFGELTRNCLRVRSSNATNVR